MREMIITLAMSLMAVTASAKNSYIPVAGVTGGVNGTYFRTDLRLYNPSKTTPIDITLHFLPQGEDGRNISGRVVHLAPRQMRVIDNVVDFLAPGLAPVIGAIRMDSDTEVSYEFVAASRTYTNAPNAAGGGTYGQFIPAFEPAEANRESVVLQVKSTPQFRANAGAMNPGSDEAVIKAALVGADGRYVLESAPFVVPPKSMRQLSMAELFGGVFLPDGYILFTSTQPVFTWGSVIDNVSGDQIFVPGRADDASVTPLSR